MFVKYGREYAEICDALRLDDERDAVLKEVAAMEETVMDAGWDGDWFLRAYDAMSNPVGSKVCEEGQIFIEPQGMCVMAGIGTDITEDGSPSAAARALRSVEERLDTRYGIILQTPAYTTYHVELGEISSYPPGYKENAGIFCHNNPWISCAETVLGHGSRAFEVFKKTCPAYLEDQSEIRMQRAVCLLSDDGRPGCSDSRRRQEQLAYRNSRLDIYLYQPVYSRYPADFTGTAYQSMYSV